MNNIKYYTDLIQKLTVRISEVEEENLILREKLSNCESKLEVLNLFYSDFKHLIRTDDVLLPAATPAIEKEKPSYDSLLSNYFVTKETGVVEKLFEDYNHTPAEVLTDIRNTLPDNIKNIVKKYKCKEEYQIIRKSTEHIKKFHYTEKGLGDLIDCYIESHGSQKKQGALRYLKQALVYFPFQFNYFMEHIQKYQYENFDEHVKQLKIELYGEDNMLLTADEKKTGKTTKVAETKKVVEAKKTLNRRPCANFKTATVDELVELVRINERKRQSAVSMYASMQKANRSAEDLQLFKEGVNKFLWRKL